MSEKPAELNMLPSDADLVAAYRQGEVGGEAVMVRLLAKVGLEHRSQEVLVRSSGVPLTDPEGNPVRAVHYLAVAGQHPNALATILNFVKMDEANPKYPQAQDLISGLIRNYLPPEAPERQ